jgi:hypothetical protein
VRIRTLKPEWLEDERLITASPAARTLSVALILLADDYGRGRGNPDILVPRIFPGHSREGREAFEELREAHFFGLYEVRGQTYFTIRNWSQHQRVDKPGTPRVPCPCGLSEKDHECPANFPESLATDRDPDPDPDPDRSPEGEQVGNQLDLVTEQPKPRFNFDAVYQLYPRKQGKAEGMKAVRAKVKTEADFQLLGTFVARMDRDWRGADTSKCPYWSTFVNQERWRDDEPLQPQKPDGRSTTPASDPATYRYHDLDAKEPNA